MISLFLFSSKNSKKFSRIAALLLGVSLFQGGFQYAYAAPDVISEAKELSKEDSSKKDKIYSLIDKYEDLLNRNRELDNEKSALLEENSKLKQEQITLKYKLDRCARREKRYREKLKEKKSNITPEEMQNEIERVKAQMILEFTSYLGEYIKNNPSKKMKNVDLRGLFSQLITFNVNYTNKGDTTFAPLAVKGTAKGTVAGAAITS